MSGYCMVVSVGEAVADAGAAERARLRELLAMLSAGDREVLGEIYDRCGADLYGLALWRTGSREDAADVVQDVFVRLASTRADLGRVSNPRGYLLAMAHRASLDVVRLRVRGEEFDGALIEPVWDDAEGRLDGKKASALLHSLPAAQREALYLRHFTGLSFAEIGATTGVPLFTAASRCRIALRRLRRAMGVKI